MTQATATRGVPTVSAPRPARSPAALFGSLELDTRLVGMLIALGIIWLGFQIVSGGLFLTPRNLWNLSVQSASIAIMACGMVLVIVSRNIDLSVGSMLGFIGYTMAMVQAQWIPNALHLGFNQPYTWLLALAVGLALGALIGGLQGVVIAYGQVPSFIVTLGGFLIWRGLIFQYAQGQTVAPLDGTFALLGGGPMGSLGEWGSWLVGIIGCVALVSTVLINRRRRYRYGFPVRPMWALVTVLVLGCAAVLGAVSLANSYLWPDALARQFAQQRGILEPPGGLRIPTGVAYPVLITIGVALAMTFLATRRRFGRYVFAIGGNPEAAELAGINVRRTITLTFVVMGILAAIAAAVQTARLNGAVTNLGIQNELDVISAAVIGGSSLSGGIGTIPGAVLGAVVMQSLRSGMVMVRVDSPTQDIVVGLVLVAAVGFDAYLRRRPGVEVTHDASPPLVELRKIRVAFGGVVAVDDVSVDLHAGEVVGLVGGNGAGKSTLMKVLSGAYVADAGQILIDGKPVSISNPRDAKALGIETIYQTLALADNIDAPGNMFLGRELVTRDGSLDDARMESATRTIMGHLNPYFTNFKTAVGWLSGGQRQAVAIARAIQFNARVLIMDEPTAALGPAETAQVRTLIQQLKTEGIGIFLISHNIHDVFDLADRISVMLHGSLVGTVNKSDVTTDEVLAMIIMGKRPDEVTQKDLAELHG